MKKLLAALCCLILASPQIVLAQAKGAENKPPLTQKEQAERTKAVHAKMLVCHHQAELKKLKQGSKEYHEYVNQCLSTK